MLYVVDAADPARFDESLAALNAFLDEAQTVAVPVMVLANKQDISDAVDADTVLLVLAMG